MPEPDILYLVFFLFFILVLYFYFSKRNLVKTIALTPLEYLWKLKQIIGKSEYDIFLIAAEEKGWPAYQAETHFKRFLEDQSLPVYVKEFLEDGKEYIDAYRSTRGDCFNRKLVFFYLLFALVVIGGSFILSLYVFPRIFPDAILSRLM